MHMNRLPIALAFLVAFSSEASMKFSSEEVSFSTTIEENCGIVVHDNHGEIIFADSNGQIIYDDTARFEVISNTSTERAIVKLTNVHKSQHIGDAYSMLVRGDNGERNVITPYVQGASLGKGEYEAIISVDKTYEEMPAGTHTITGTLEIECEAASVNRFRSSRIN